MTLKEKTSLEFITLCAEGKRPILLCSFSKDSMVALHLIRQVIPDIPVILWKTNSQQERYSFAQEIIRDWGLTVYDYPPLINDIMYKDGKMNGVAGYWLGRLISYKVLWLTQPYGHFSCAVEDILNRPTCDGYKFSWDCVFSAHKKIDVDLLLGNLTLKKESITIDALSINYPLLNWTDKEIWKYIRRNNIPYNRRKYDHDGNVLMDTTYNENYYSTCVKCLDPMDNPNVWCERKKKEIQNIGKLIDYKNRLKVYTDKFKTYMDMEEEK